ncbi:glycosyltransferase [Yonghaparkia sp. Root332]|uniref:glycosyltransferase n=1 Tax=Yonghaparkia sp. Root332 TaxID=1736516 RepID=UPI0006FD90D8|nr:glycosyltransferase [Yonghaparkia sp. Root332]KQV25466.1 mannosyltransferase [Yonghaparkia sp. Root332]
MRDHEVSVVIPVYRGARTLEPLLAEIAVLAEGATSTDGHRWRVVETVLVFDHGSDGSDAVIRRLAEQYDFVRPVWLSRNFGQHSATLAGMSATTAEWIATIDEDGQHDPALIGALLDVALARSAPLVYARPTNAPPHGWLRNSASRAAKRVVAGLLPGAGSPQFQSFRLMTGEIGRSVAGYAGPNVYLDVALGWVVPRVATADVRMREEGAPSGYSLGRLIGHFWRLVLSSGTRGLRLVSVIGAVTALAGFALALLFIVQRLIGVDLPEGWTSTMVVLLVATGFILMSLGVVAEYLGMAVNMAMGRPAYLTLADPENGPLGRARSQAAPRGGDDLSDRRGTRAP